MNNNLPTKYEESIFRRIANKIKAIFSKKEDISYPGEDITCAGNVDTNQIQTKIDYNKEFRNRIQNKSNEISIQRGTLDYAIDQFLLSYYANAQKDGKVNAYKSLTNIEAKEWQQDDNGSNKRVEENLLSVLEENGEFYVEAQKDKNMTYFYHVQTPDYKMDNTATKMRIYINCDRKNVASLAGELLTKLQNEKFYLKFSSDEQLSKTARSEAIVIYTDEYNINNIMEHIGQLEKESPELFEGSENTSPFIYRAGKVGYVREIPDNQKYINKYNNEETLAQSYNTFLSKALEESFVEACKSVVSFDKELTYATNGEISDDPNFYMMHMDEIMNGHYTELIRTMKQELTKVQERNSYLDIKGISDKAKKRGDNNEREF